MNRNAKIGVISIIVFVMLVVTVMVAGKEHRKGHAVQNAEDAMSIANAAFAIEFGEDEEWGALEAEYNRWDGTWHVYGILPEGMVGGVPEAIISGETGQVRYIWHGK